MKRRIRAGPLLQTVLAYARDSVIGSFYQVWNRITVQLLVVLPVILVLIFASIILSHLLSITPRAVQMEEEMERRKLIPKHAPTPQEIEK